MRKTVLMLLTVLLVTSGCASNDSNELDIGVDTPPLQLVHVDESPTITFTEPVVGPGSPQERDDTSKVPPPVTYPSTAPDDGDAVPEPWHTHGEPDDAYTHNSTTVAPTTSTTVSVQLDVSQNVVCGAGLVKLDEFVTETDNGCRTADCVYGRNATGNCRWYSEWAAELVRDCPTVDTSDGLGAMDQNVSDNSVPPIEFPQLEAGTNWTAEIWLVDNNHFVNKPDNNNDTFIVALRTPPEGGFTYVPSVPGGPGGSLLLSNDATDGEWSVPFAVHENTPLHNPFELSVTASGSGCWAVRFTPS